MQFELRMKFDDLNKSKRWTFRSTKFVSRVKGAQTCECCHFGTEKIDYSKREFRQRVSFGIGGRVVKRQNGTSNGQNVKILVMPSY